MTLKQVKSVLSKVTFVKSCIDFGWKWEVKESYEKDSVVNGFFIRTTFRRPDINTGEIGEGFGRWMFFPKNCSEDCVVKTAWVCCELIVKHELLESFLYEGNKIFDPHKSLEELSYTKEIKVSLLQIQKSNLKKKLEKA